MKISERIKKITAAAATAVLVFSIALSTVVQVVNATDVTFTLLEAPTDIMVDPASWMIHVGQTRQYTATAVFSDLSTQDITNDPLTTWNSSNPLVATVSSTGLATGISNGTIMVSASYGGELDMASLQVQPVTLTAVEVRPPVVDVNIENGVQFEAWAIYSDSSEIEVTSDPAITWSSDDPNIATVTNTGFADSVNPGTVFIRAEYLGFPGEAELQVNAPSFINITPVGVGLNVGQTQQFTATAVFPDASTRNVTASVFTTWGSDNAAVANVTIAGLATALSPGTAILSGTYFGVTGNAAVIVNTGGGPPPPGGGGGGAGGSTYTPPGEEPPVEEPPVEGPDYEPPAIEETPDYIPPAVEQPVEQPVIEQPVIEEPVIEQPAVEQPRYVSPIYEVPPPPEGEEEPALVRVEEPVFGVPVTLEEHRILEAAFLPDELGVTRGEVMEFMNAEFYFPEMFGDFLDGCFNDLYGCLSVVEGVSRFDEFMIDPNYCVKLPNGKCRQTTPPYDISNSKLYPDVVPENPFYYYGINLGTMLAIIQGYYEEPQSPFRPYRIISRIEAIKIILGSVNMIDWLYYPELQAYVGGEDGISRQSTVFADVVPTREFMWWYPRYVNLACNVDMIDCYKGTNLRPDEYITEAELFEMLRRIKDFMNKTDYIEEIHTDEDGDMLDYFEETSLYFTEPQASDTDGDLLLDGVEIHRYQTNPFMKDSDWEGLDDYEEVMKYKTDPLDQDTDDDKFSDYIEVIAGTDPLNPASYPSDLNGNGIADVWEELYGITVADGLQDTDGDGLSDKMEYRYGTDPTKVDTDGDGFTDAEEVLMYRTDPNDPNDPGTLDNLGVRITNFRQNQLVGDSTPLIKGVGPPGAEIRVVLMNDYGHERVLGSTIVDENYVWIFDTPDPIRDGRYQLKARALLPAERQVIESYPIHIIIDTTLNVTKPSPKKLADQQITEDMLIKNLRVRIRDNKPVLTGETEFGNEVQATWRSVVLTSALIADSVTGEFEIEAPQLMELGDHEVYVTATRITDEAQSETVKLLFNVGTPRLGGLMRGVTEGLSLWDMIMMYWWLILLILLILAALFIIWCYYRKKKREEEREKHAGAKGKGAKGETAKEEEDEHLIC